MLVSGMRSVPATDGVVVDASALRRFDSSALAMLREFRLEALAAGRTFAIRGFPHRLDSLAALYGIEGLLPAA